jgi:hypothetical protein
MMPKEHSSSKLGLDLMQVASNPNIALFNVVSTQGLGWVVEKLRVYCAC